MFILGLMEMWLKSGRSSFLHSELLALNFMLVLMNNRVAVMYIYGG